MGQPGHPTRTTILVGLLLALLLAGAYGVLAVVNAPPDPAEAPSPIQPFPSFPKPTPPPDTPRAGKDFPVRQLGSLTGRSVIVPGHGNADLRYARQAHNATRLHFTCEGCDADSWLVELPRAAPVGSYGPLEHPADVTAVVDLTDPRSRTGLLVKAPRGSDWTVTLTPFEQIPVHRESFDALDDDVVAVRTTVPLKLVCGGPVGYSVIAREAGRQEFENLQLRQDDRAGTWDLQPGRGTDLLVLDVSCPGRWSIVVP